MENYIFSDNSFIKSTGDPGQKNDCAVSTKLTGSLHILPCFAGLLTPPVGCP